jgi:hypothetical protein
MTTPGVNGRRQPALAIGKRPWSPQAPSLFSTPDADSIAMAVQAAGTAEDPATIAGSLVALIDELQDTLENPSTDRARSAVGRDMVRDAKWSQPVRIQHTLWAAV